MATDYTFTANGGSVGLWDDPDNWSPTNGPPGDDDHAIIPNGKTCEVTYDDMPNQRAETIDVQSGGTLKIVGVPPVSRLLTIGHATQNTTSTVNGTVIVEAYGVLKALNTVTINGSGTITANGVGWLGDDGAGTFTVGANIGTAPGDVLVVACDLELNGNGVFDGGGEIRLGPTSGTGFTPDITGTGKFDIDSGELVLRQAQLGATTPRWDLLGGTATVSSHAAGLVSNLNVRIIMTSGTFHVSASPFKTTANCSFSGGTVTVDSGKTAEIATPP